MDETVYFQHYRVCTDEHGLAEEVSRSGAAINYKAVDTSTGEAVVLQVIPLASIDPAKREQFEKRAEAVQKLDHVNIARVREAGSEHERFVFVSEYLQGETADSWVIAHGPLAPDATLRVALQVVRAIGAAAFQGLTHRAIQPANLLIVPGPAPEGGWPFVKLLNFDVAGLELHSASGEARELAPALQPQFASPEQLRGGEIDFRSEVYSLGATMCFLLAGAVPLAVGGKSVRARLRSLPELRRAPRRLRKLLAQMLHENPGMRPQDPVALEKQIQKALGITRPRQQVVRSLTPVAPVLPEQPVAGPAPLTQVLRGAIAVAALLLFGGIAAAFLFPKAMPWHRSADIGKPVGVPETSTSSAQRTTATIGANQPQPSPAAAAAASAPEQPAPAEERQEQTAGAAVATAPEQATTATGPRSTERTGPERQETTANAHAAEKPAAPAGARSSASRAIAEKSTQAPPTAEESQAAPFAEGPTSHAKSRRTTAASETKAPAESSSESSPAAGAIAENATQTSPAAQQSEAAPQAEGAKSHAKSRRTREASEIETPAEGADEASVSATSQRTDSSKNKARVARVEKKPPKAIPLDPAIAAEEDEAIRRAGQVRAQFAGTTADGRLMLRLPSGKIVTVTPRDEQQHAAEPRRHRRATEPQEYPRAEPLNPDEEPRY